MSAPPDASGNDGGRDQDQDHDPNGSGPGPGTETGTGDILEGVPGLVITLKEEEYDKAARLLRMAGFDNLTRLAGVNGKEKRHELVGDRNRLSYRAESEIMFAPVREAHSSMPSWGGPGCYLSHVAAWEQAARSPSGVIVFEADVMPFENSRALFAEKLDQLTRHRGGTPPDLLFMSTRAATGLDKLDTPDGISRLTDRKYGTEAYYVSPDGARKLLRDALPMEVQVDSYMGYKILRGAIAKTGAGPGSSSNMGSSTNAQGASAASSGANAHAFSDPSGDAFDAYAVDTPLASYVTAPTGSSIQTKMVEGGEKRGTDWVLIVIVLAIVVLSVLFVAEYRRLHAHHK